MGPSVSKLHQMYSMPANAVYKIFCRATIALLAAATLSSGLPENHLDDQVEAAIEAGTFANPSANVRPRFRYWLPDASVNLSRVALDIADAKHVGAGGVEVLGYYLYDSAPGNIVPTDWTTYGWGTPAWSEFN
jgi:Arc/MetJ-type ribon-helix-helix transcriptional regulator